MAVIAMPTIHLTQAAACAAFCADHADMQHVRQPIPVKAKGVSGVGLKSGASRITIQVVAGSMPVVVVRGIMQSSTGVYTVDPAMEAVVVLRGWHTASLVGAAGLI